MRIENGEGNYSVSVIVIRQRLSLVVTRTAIDNDNDGGGGNGDYKMCTIIQIFEYYIFISLIKLVFKYSETYSLYI